MLVCWYKVSRFRELCAADLSNSLDSELRRLRETYSKLKKEYDHAKEKLKFFEKV